MFSHSETAAREARERREKSDPKLPTTFECRRLIRFENVRRKRRENIAGLSGGATIPRAPLSSTN